MHNALPIGQSTVLMGSGVFEIMQKATENDNRNTIFISADSREEADKLFSELSQTGEIEMPISDGLADSYFG